MEFETDLEWLSVLRKLDPFRCHQTHFQYSGSKPLRTSVISGGLSIVVVVTSSLAFFIACFLGLGLSCEERERYISQSQRAMEVASQEPRLSVHVVGTNPLTDWDIGTWLCRACYAAVKQLLLYFKIKRRWHLV